MTKFQWIIGGIIILLCTAFEIHGSSIGAYAYLLNHPELGGEIYGEWRSLRSDEWLVFTPFAFSQYFTNFSMVSDIVRGAATNMFITYGQTVLHPAVLFRPAQIGYLLFDAGSGLAFFWTSRLVILFLISYAFARIILQLDKKLSILYTIMVTFSPLAQWWWSVNSIAEILAAGQGVIICWNLYLEQGDTPKRFWYVAGFLYCAGVFIFGIYPAWQVSFGYVFLFCLIAVTFRQADVLKSLWRDKIFWLVGFAVMLAPIAHALYVSRDMIEVQMATEYPGKRFELSGGWSLNHFLMMMTSYGLDVLSPFRPIWTVTNNCEAATFFALTPLGILMFFWITFKLKLKDPLLIALFAVILLLSIWEMVDLPEWLAKISCMGMTTNSRVRPVIDFAQLLMLFRGLTLMQRFSPSIELLLLAEILALIAIMGAYQLLPDWFNFRRICAIFIYVGVSVFLFLTPMNLKTFFILAIMMLRIGLSINPIVQGVAPIYESPVGQKISEIVQSEVTAGKEKSLWIVDDNGMSYNDFPIMFGAPTINSVNVYPTLERWKKLDPDGKYFTVYNRYAHITLTLQREPTEFILGNMDGFKLNLNVEDLPTLEVGYIFSKRKGLEYFSSANVKISKVYEDAGLFIYKVN